MGEYFKMADVITGEVKNIGSEIRDQLGAVGRIYGPLTFAEHVSHAISSHDELVENVQHYKQEAEQWELRATKEASRAQDLDTEVERLKKSAELAIITLDEVDRVLAEKIKNGAYDLDDISGEVTYALERISGN